MFIDLKKAYDKVIYKRLFNKIIEQGISEDRKNKIIIFKSKIKNFE